MNKEYIDKVRTSVRVSVCFAASGVLNLNEEECIALYRELLVISHCLDDKDTMMLVCNELGLLFNKLKLYNEALQYQQIHLSLAIETNNKTFQVKAYDSLGYIHLLINKPWDALSSYEKQRNISIEIGDKKSELDSCEMLGAINLALGHHVDAIKSYKQQLAVAIETDNEKEQKSAYINMTKTYEKMEAIPYDQVVKCYEEWLKIPSQDEKQEKRSVYGRLGNIYQQLNNFDQATECYQKSLEIAKQQSDEKLEIMLYLNLGLTYFSQEKFQEASYYYEKALKLAIKLDDKDLQGKAYDKLGRLYAEHTRDYAKAIEYGEKALQIAAAMDDIVGQLDCHEMLGCVHLTLGNNGDAIKSFKQQLDTAINTQNIMVQKMAYLNMADAYKNMKDSPHIASCLEDWLNISSQEDEHKKGNVYLDLGNAYQEMGNTNEAIKCYENSLEITHQLPNQKLEIILNINLGYSFFSQGKFLKATDYYGKGVELAIKLDDRTLEGKAYDKLGCLYKNTGDCAKAIEHFEKALAVAVDADKEGEATACENLGDVYQSTLDYNEALKFHQRQLQICINIDSKCGQARAYRKLGLSYERLGDFSEAIKNEAKDLEMRVGNGDKKGEAEALFNLGTTNKLLGQYHEAHAHHTKSLETARQIGDLATEKSANRGLGDILFLLHNYKEAAGYFEESLNIAKKLDDKLGAGLDYGRLGICKMKFREYNKSLELFNDQIRLAKETGDKELEADGYFSKGTICKILEDYQQAMICFKEHVKIAEEINDKKNEICGLSYSSLGEVYISIANLNEKKGEQEKKEQCIAESIHFLKEALRWHEYLFGQLHEQDNLKISILDTFFQDYNLLTLMLLASEQDKEALLASERGRARALSELLVTKYNMDQDSQPGPITYAEIENMAANFSILFYSLLPPVKCTWVIVPGNPTSLIQDADEALLSNVVHNVYGRFRDREIQCEDRSVHENENQQKQKPSVRMSQKFIAIDKAGSSEKLMLSACEMIMKRCIPDEDLYDDDDDNSSPLEGLYKSLISPVLHELTKDEIVIIPDGLLFMVPFAALRDPCTGAFLSETKQIRLAPSLTSLKVLEESPTNFHNKTGALIIGNPKGDLPGAEKEAKMIGDLLNVKPLIGPEATKKATKEKLKEGVAIVHFAAHGTKDGKILLAPSTTGDMSSEQDYILTMKDVQESGGHPQLVVLSCCHSGRGEIKAAEGVVGMSRAFLAAGARAVVASLWAIDDHATMVFMERFYTHLKQEESASKSLQAAMKDMREIPRYNDPHFWAPFFLIGDDVTGIKM